MNPLTNVKNITKLNEIELSKGTVDKKSWHDMYKDSAWIFIGGLAYGLTEGDVLAVFSQYGEIVNINLVRDKKTGKTKGFCFLCYANQKSTILAVDNFNGIKLLNRTIRVDHVLNYKPPKDNEHDDEITKQLKSEGCAPKPLKQEASPDHVTLPKKKKSKKEKKKRKKSKKEADEKSHHKKPKIKKEKHDPGYDKYEFPKNSKSQSRKSRSSDSELSSSGESSDEQENSWKQDRERVHDKRIGETYHKAVTNDGKYNSNKKRNFKDSESDSDNDYVKQKKSKTAHVEDRNRISSNAPYIKREVAKSRNDSISSERSSSNDGEKSSEEIRSSKKYKSSHSKLSKNLQMHESRRKETVQHRRGSSSTEDIDESSQYNDQSRARDSLKHYRSEDSYLKGYERSPNQHTVLKSNRDKSDQRHDSERKSNDHQSDHRMTDIRGEHRNDDRSYARDHRMINVRSEHRNNDRQSNNSNARDYKMTDIRSETRNDDRQSDCSSARDHRMTDARSDRRNNYQDDRKSKNAGSDSMEESSHSRKYSDYRSNDKRGSENSNRDLSKYSKSVEKSRYSSTEREEKHYKHRDRDDNRKDYYDRRKK